MSIISIKIINRPRKLRNCEECNQPMYAHQIRLYGSSDGDKPYVMYQHEDCAIQYPDSAKLIAKLRETG